MLECYFLMPKAFIYTFEVTTLTFTAMLITPTEILHAVFEKKHYHLDTQGSCLCLLGCNKISFSLVIYCLIKSASHFEEFK